MVWACFWGGGRSELVRMTRDSEAKKQGYTANSYLEVLNENLLEMYEPGLVSMEDNAPIHCARKIRKWFEEMGVDGMDWPPYSPGLNPIEYLWFRLKELVYEVNPNIRKG